MTADRFSNYLDAMIEEAKRNAIEAKIKAEVLDELRNAYRMFIESKGERLAR